MKKFLVVFNALTILVITGCTGNNNRIIEASGNIEATNIIISSQVSGEVTQILKDEGAKVIKGDTVLIIDPEMYELKLQEALAYKDGAEAQFDLLKKGARSEDVNQAEENFRQAQISFELAEKGHQPVDAGRVRARHH